MATFPCLHCGQRFHGEARNVYLSIFEGDTAAKFRYVVCPPCLELLVEPWLTKSLWRNPNGVWEDLEPNTTLDGLFCPQERPESPRSIRKVS